MPTTPAAFRDRFGILVNIFTFGLPSDRLFALVPWQLALGPDDVHEIGKRLARDFT